MRKFVVVLTLLVVVLGMALPVTAQEEPTQTIAEIVTASAAGDPAEFTVLLAAVAAADPAVLELLSSPEASVTVFAPTDAAFAAALEALGMTAEDVLADPLLLNVLLAYHVVPMALPAEAVVAANGAYVGTVLPDSPLLITASDEGVMVNESNVVTADVMATNGVIHVIDAVLLPDMEAVNEMMMMETPETMGTILDTAVAMTTAETPEFTSLVGAVTAADPSFVAALGSDLPYTVFAPTDESFAAVLAALGLDAETLFANTALINGVLAYHVLPGAFTSTGIIGLLEMSEEGTVSIVTLAGIPLPISATEDGASVFLNGDPEITVTTADVYADNGLIHVINGVLTPQ